jgi:signal transduction histidine kinase
VRGWARSIGGRLAALSALATVVALLVAGWAIAGVLERFVTRGIDQRLDAQIALLASTVGADGRVDARLLRSHRGLLTMGREWRWTMRTPRETLGDAELATLPMQGVFRHRRPGPLPGEDDGPPMPADRDGAPTPLDGTTPEGTPLHARRYALATAGGAVTITVAAPRAVIARPIREAVTPLLLALAVLGALLGAATWLQLRVGLRPLHALRDAVAALRAGRIDRIDEDQPSELRPLAIELNALAADTEAALATARLSAANLAHALKTPVATLALAVADDPVRRRQVERIDATIRHHLGRARAGAGRPPATPLAPAIADLCGVVARLHADRGVGIGHEIDPEMTVRLDAHDLDELAGNLIDNAARHARTRVRVTADHDGRTVTLRVIDDGPGIAAADRARATEAGVRLDERGDGHGFGLAIVRDIAALHGGALVLDETLGGGLTAAVTLPA